MADKKPVYIRCPRCELNYIQKKDKLCSVCKAELSAKDDYVDELDLELCPVCKTNYIQSDEVMCQSCLKERALDNDIHGITNENDEWDAYINRDEDEIISPDEETGDMAVVNSLDEADLLDGDDDLTFDDDLDEDAPIDDEEIDEEESDDFDDYDDEDEDYDDDDEDDYDDYDDDDDDK